MAEIYRLAIDIGASSGRHIVGWEEGGKIMTEEVYRFKNGVEELGGSLVWNTEALFCHVKEGIKRAIEKFPRISSLAIDTWGVDYVLMNGQSPILPCAAYRDDRTAEVIEEVHARISFDELYKRTGIQFQPFNTIYQLYEDKKRGRLSSVTDFLMIPEYLNYLLTGAKKKEYTNATTTGLVNARTGDWDGDIIDLLGFPREIFGKLYTPGESVGMLKERARWRAFPWTAISRISPRAHGRFWELNHPLPTPMKAALRATGRTRAAWAMCAIRRISWACGWSTA